MRQTQRALMLFAAGFGTRMGALVANCPKPLLMLAGKPLIDHALDLAALAGVTKTVVNVHYLGDQIARHLASRPGITVLWERDQILETGGGLRAALPHLGPDPVFTLNPDAVWRGVNPLLLLENAWKDADMDALLLLLPVGRVQGRAGAADFLLAPDGRLSRAGAVGQHLYLGAQIIRTDRLAGIPGTAFSLNLMWDRMIADGRAYGLVYPGAWCDVGTPQGLADAQTMLARDHV